MHRRQVDDTDRPNRALVHCLVSLGAHFVESSNTSVEPKGAEQGSHVSNGDQGESQ